MPTSDKGDLTGLADDIKEVFEEHDLEEPALAVAFTLAEDRRNVHWVTNLRRSDGIKLFAATAEKMQSEVN
jgi:membrane-bound lytic murein transglycosylase MltF